MSAFDYKLSTITKYRAGTIADPYIDITESKKIVNNQILLSEIPVKKNRVIISGYVEIDEVPKTGLESIKFIVDYNEGIIQFNASEEGKTLSLTYKGRGNHYVSAARIWTEESLGNVTQTLADIIGSASQFKHLGTYNNVTLYRAFNIVSYNGGSYLAIKDTQGNLPTNSTYWAKISGYMWRGEYSSSTTYSTGDTVNDVNKQNIYQSLIDSNTNYPLTDTSKWSLLVSVTDAVNTINTTNTNITNAETARVSAENTRVSQENTRETQETGRVNAESSRVIAESERVTAENNRVSAESNRVTAETARVNAETIRGTNETARQTAETNRATAESGRVTAESNRVTEETGRTTAETNRENKENDRVTAETGRNNAETSRVNAETARASAESSRQTKETDRNTAETARASAESSRITVEAARVSAENTRSTNETNRQTNEDNRQSKETERQSNETTRETNETTRQSQESARQTNTTTAINNANTAATNAQNVADRTVHKGAYNSATSYMPNNIVSYNGSSYMNIIACTNVLPTDTSKWQLIGQKGDQGIQGIQGIQGARGVNWKGDYDPATAYTVDDGVFYNGSSYRCILNSTGNVPTNVTYWFLLAQKGTDGTGTGTVTNVSSANGDIVVANPTTTPTLTLNTGTGANQIVKLNQNKKVSADILTEGNIDGFLGFKNKVKLIYNESTGVLEIWGVN